MKFSTSLFTLSPRHCFSPSILVHTSNSQTLVQDPDIGPPLNPQNPVFPVLPKRPLNCSRERTPMCPEVYQRPLIH